MASPVATVWAQFRLDMSDFASKLNTASATLKNFAKVQQNVLKQQNQGYDKASAMIRSFNRSLSDTVNITRGIVISQAFYAAVGAIRDATSALWDFNKELDYAHVTYSALFGDAALAKDFMAVLQEHAIDTVFNYQDLAGMSKKLLAYGIDYKNLMFIMEGLTNLGAMSGDPAALDRIALALGQIYTKGKLSAEEMRQLANAYVPITEIITEKFGLSEEDLGRVGDLNLPAEDVINAVVDYANENFGNVGDAAMMTITGLEAKIVDTLKTVGTEMLKPLSTAYKSFLLYISKGLENIREAFATGGIGGVFEYLVPNEGTQKTIRIFLANVKNLFTSVMSLGKAAGQVFGNFAQVFVAVFNAVVPAITAVTNALAIVVSAMASTRAGAALLRVALVAVAGAFVLMRVQAIGALVVTAVTKAINALSKALVVLASVIAKHPIFSLLAMLGVALLGVSVSSNNANMSLSGLFDTLAGASGSSSGDMLQKTEQEIIDANAALDQFNDRLGDAVDGTEDLEEGIGDAGKEAKKTSGLLSFDEVFKLPDNENDKEYSYDGPGIADDIAGIVGDLSVLGDALVPEIPDFSEYLGEFNDSLLGGLSDDLMDKISAGGWGAVIGGILGALIGAAFGNPLLGAKIGMAAGAFVGVIFDEIKYAINNTGTGTFTGIWMAITKGLSKAGAAGLGTIAANAFKSGGFKGLWTAIAGVVKSTGLKAISKGGIIGFAVGLVVDSFAHLLWNTMEEKFENASADTAKVGQTIGGIIGTVVGMFFGPAGAIIGSVIGTFAGGIVGLFWENVKEAFKDPDINLGTLIGNRFAGLQGGIVAGAIFRSLFGDDFSIKLSEITSSIDTWLDATSTRLSTWWSNTELEKNLSAWWEDTKSGFSTWWEDTNSGFSTWWEDTKSGFAVWASDTIASVSTWWEDTNSGFSTWWEDTKSGFSTWWEDTKSGFSLWLSNTTSIFSDWDTITGETLGDWWEDTKEGFSTWVSDTAGKLSDWASDTFSSLGNWWNDTKLGFTTWASDTDRKVRSWATDTDDKIRTWVFDTAKSLYGWWQETKSGFTNWVTDVDNKIRGWVTDTDERLQDWVYNTAKDIATWVEGTRTDISSWASRTAEKFSNWYNDASKVFNGFAIAAGKAVADWATGTWTDISNWASKTSKTFSAWLSDTGASISTWFSQKRTQIVTDWNSMWDPAKWKSGWESIKKWFNDLWKDISSWFYDLSNSVSNWWDGLWSGKKANVNISSGSSPSLSLGGHAAGGVFNREHIARFAENNKAEAIIPLENNRAMQPFVDAVSAGIVSSLAPIVAGINAGNNSGLPPMYVGTLVADDRGLRELYKRFEVIQVQENARRGIVKEAL